MYKRYEYLSSSGKTWTQWFKISDVGKNEKWQTKNKLRNEYKETLDDL